MNQEKQGGSIGVVVSSSWFEPLRNLTDDQLAIQRALSFESGWCFFLIILFKINKRYITINVLTISNYIFFRCVFLKRFLDPIILGDYPSEMRKILGSDLPVFTSENRNLLLKTKLDFIGINHYSTMYVKDCILSQCVLNSFEGNGLLATTGQKDGKLIGNPVCNKY